MLCASGYMNLLFAMIGIQTILFWLIDVTGEAFGRQLLLLILQVIWWYLWVLLRALGSEWNYSSEVLHERIYLVSDVYKIDKCSS